MPYSALFHRWLKHQQQHHGPPDKVTGRTKFTHKRGWMHSAADTVMVPCRSAQGHHSILPISHTVGIVVACVSPHGKPKPGMVVVPKRPPHRRLAWRATKHGLTLSTVSTCSNTMLLDVECIHYCCSTCATASPAHRSNDDGSSSLGVHAFPQHAAPERTCATCCWKRSNLCMNGARGGDVVRTSCTHGKLHTAAASPPSIPRKLPSSEPAQSRRWLGRSLASGSAHCACCGAVVCVCL